MTLPGFTTVKREAVEVSGAGVHDHQRRNARWRRAGDDHRHRREPIVDVQSTRRQQIVDDETLKALPGHARLQRARVPGALGHRRQQPDRPDARDAHLLQPRRPRQRRPRVGGRPERRLGVQRRRRVGLHRRHRELAGNADDAVGRSRRDRDGRRHRELRPEDRRQHVLGQRLLQQRRRVVAGQQHRRRGSRPSASPDPPALYQNWDVQRLGRRPDHSATSCGSSATTATSARTTTSSGCTPTRTPATRTAGPTFRIATSKARSAVATTITAHPPHVAGDAAEQGRLLLTTTRTRATARR